MERDIWHEVLDGIREILSGKGKKVSVSFPPAARVRQATGLSRGEFSEIPGVSARPLRDGKQGRRKPSGAAAPLPGIAEKNPSPGAKRTREETFIEGIPAWPGPTSTRP